jgi:hypothetical protein
MYSSGTCDEIFYPQIYAGLEQINVVGRLCQTPGVSQRRPTIDFLITSPEESELQRSRLGGELY